MFRRRNKQTESTFSRLRLAGQITMTKCNAGRDFNFMQRKILDIAIPR